MWIDAEDARSDFVLATAAFLLGDLVRDLVERLPLYPQGGLVGSTLDVAWLFVVTGLVPLLLARYRRHGLHAFGLAQGPWWSPAWVAVLPVAGAGMLEAWTRGQDLPDALLGVFADLPTDPTGLLLRLGTTTALAAGTVLLVGFLTVRSRDGFRGTPIPLLAGLRTFGMGAAGAALLLGLLNAVRPMFSLLGTLWAVGALAALILAVDRVVEPGQTTTRATLLAPAIVVGVHKLFGFGGLIGNVDLLSSLYLAALAGGTTIALSALIETGRHGRTAAVLAVVGIVYVSPVTPLLSILPVTSP